MKEQSKLLTSRQKEILSLLRKGLTNAEICMTLNISENTVKVHLANIYKILEVTNRTEAVSANLDEKAPSITEDNDIHIVITGSDGLKETSMAKGLSLSIVEALQRYQLFRIRENSAAQPEPTYRIQVMGTQSKDDSLFVTLYRGNTSEIIWSTTQRIGEEDDIKLLASRIAIYLFMSMASDASRIYEKNKNQTPQWWFASCHAYTKVENHCRESLGEIISSLESLTKKENHHIYAAYSLAIAYYVAISESWVSVEEYAVKIGELACTEMRDNPYSIYSQFMMAIYNIIIGNKLEAIAYFLQILESNPQDFRVRRMLAQIYLLIGKEDKALNILNENERYLPESAGQPLQSSSKAFIYYLQGRYEESEEVARQTLLFHPETPLARLIIIGCKNKKGDFEESEKHIQKLFKYHPYFKKETLERLLSGISPSKKDLLLNDISNVFR